MAIESVTSSGMEESTNSYCVRQNQLNDLGRLGETADAVCPEIYPDFPDMSNNLNIVSSLETYKKSCPEKYPAIPFGLNIGRCRRVTSKEGGETTVKYLSAYAPNDLDRSDLLRTPSPERRLTKNCKRKRKQKLKYVLCFLGWILFFPCCAVGLLMRETPASDEDLDSDPCWPGSHRRDRDIY